MKSILGTHVAFSTMTQLAVARTVRIDVANGRVPVGICGWYVSRPYRSFPLKGNMYSYPGPLTKEQVQQIHDQIGLAQGDEGLALAFDDDGCVVGLVGADRPRPQDDRL